MKSLPPIEELRAHLEQHLVSRFVRFRSAWVRQPGQTCTLEPVEMDMSLHVTETEVSNEDGIREILAARGREEIPANGPLWDMVLVHNKGTGLSGIVARYDHALADGLSLLPIFDEIFTKQDGSRPGLSGSFTRRTTTPTGAGQRLMSAVRYVLIVIRSLLKVAYIAGPLNPFDTKTILHPAAVRDHGLWSGRRHVCWTPLVPLASFADLRKRRGVTVNDILTAALAGTLRRYMQKHDDPALKGPLTVRMLLPFQFPRKSDPVKPLRNNFAFLTLNIPVGEADAAKRLDIVHTTLAEMKVSPEPLLIKGIQWVGARLLPFAELQKAARLLFQKHTLAFSNVPGPPETVYLCGRPIEAIRPCVFTLCNQVTAFSYRGQVGLSVEIDDEHMPDYEEFGALFQQEVESLLASSGK